MREEIQATYVYKGDTMKAYEDKALYWLSQIAESNSWKQFTMQLGRAVVFALLSISNSIKEK